MIALLSLVFVVMLGIIYSKAIRSQTKRSPRALPILGHILSIPRRHPWLAFTEWAETYGNIIPLTVFDRRLLVLNSIDDARELFEKRSSIYSERAPRQMAYLCGFREALLFRMYNHDTRKSRKIFHSEINKQAMGDKSQLIEEEVMKCVRRLTLTCPDVGAEGLLLSASVALSISYGYQPKGDKDANVAITFEFMRFIDKVVTPNLYLVDSLPFLRFVPSWFPGAHFQKEAKHCRKLVHDMVSGLYQDAVELSRKGQIPACLVSKNMEACEKNGDSRVLMWTAADFTGAGLHTTSYTVKFFFEAMLLYPEVLTKLQEEVDRVVGDSRLPSLSDRGNMPYLECVLKEIYRWRPVIPLVAHSCRNDDKYGDLAIRAGTVVMANTWKMAHDEDLYPDAHRFYPERFMNPETQDPKEFLFGFGRRFCPGQNLVDQVLWTLVATTAATVNILPALDSNGNEVLPTGEFSSGAIIEPLPFDCRVEVRSDNAKALLRADEDL